MSRGGVTTTLTYDYADRKTGMSDPDMGAWSYTYNALDLTAQTDARSCTTTLAYNSLDQLLSKTFSGSCDTTTDISFVYSQGTNGIGRRTHMSDASGATDWGYDDNGRVITETRTITDSLGTFTTAWGYNSAGQVDWMQYPADDQGNTGEQLDYGYLPQLALGVVTSTITGTLTTLSYDAAGRVKGRVFGEQGLASAYQYYPWTSQGGRLETLTSGPSGDPDGLQSLTYIYDDMGNVLSIADAINGSPQTQVFDYDDIYRLISAQASGGNQGNYAQQSYTYDPNTGNLFSKAGVSYTYGDGRHAHAVTSLSNGNTYAYDANGNMTQRYISGQTYTLSYDAENHMTGVSGAASASFAYNGDGQRVISTVGGDTTVFIGNYFEWHVATDLSTKYYYADTTRIAMRTDAGGMQFILGDHLGSSSVMANPSGALAQFSSCTPCMSSILDGGYSD